MNHPKFDTVVRKIEPKIINEMKLDVSFAIRDIMGGSILLSQIKNAFFGCDKIERISPSYSTVMKGLCNQYRVTSKINTGFFDGIQYLADLVQKGKIEVIGCVRLSIPEGLNVDRLVKTELVFPDIVEVYPKRHDDYFFYIDFYEIIRKIHLKSCRSKSFP